MAKDDVIEIEGIVTDALPNAMFNVDIGNGHTILAHISGKILIKFIRSLPEMFARMVCPLPISTLNIAFGRESTTMPSISITSSFAKLLTSQVVRLHFLGVERQVSS